MAKCNDFGQSGLREEDGASLTSSQPRQKLPKPNSFALKTEETRSCEISYQTYYTTLDFKPPSTMLFKSQLLSTTEGF